jgi:hypothetical protein
MKNWTVMLVSNARALPRNIPGVYLLFSGRTLDYVGQSDHVRQRLLQEHHVYYPDLHRVVALIQAQPYDERLALERYFNQKYNPANSYIGSGKQDASFDSRFLQFSPDQRRTMWAGPDFSEFELPENPEADFDSYQLEISSDKISLNRLDVPSVLSLPPEELFG